MLRRRPRKCFAPGSTRRARVRSRGFSSPECAIPPRDPAQGVTSQRRRRAAACARVDERSAVCPACAAPRHVQRRPARVHSGVKRFDRSAARPTTGIGITYWFAAFEDPRSPVDRAAAPSRGLRPFGRERPSAWDRSRRPVRRRGSGHTRHRRRAVRSRRPTTEDTRVLPRSSSKHSRADRSLPAGAACSSAHR